MDMRTPQATGQLGAVRWFNTSNFLFVVFEAQSERSFPVTWKNCSKVMSELMPSISSSFLLNGFVTNSIAARNTPNGAYRQAVVQAAMRHAVKA